MIETKGHPQLGDRGGFALVVVILVLMISSFLASQLIMQVRTDLKISTNNKLQVVGRMLAEGGINLALFRIVDKPGIDYEEKLGGPRLLGGYPYETVLSTGKIEYYAVDETGKIDLNKTRTSPELVKRFLAYQGLEPEEIDIVIDSWQDWWDDNDLHLVNGAENDYYEDLANPYIAHNGNIVDPAEFFLIRGTEKLRGRFDPYDVFTVNGGAKINIAQLSPEMLDFMVGGNKELAERVREEQKLLSPRPLSRDRFLEIIEDNSLKPFLSLNSSAGGKFYSIVAYGYPGEFSESSGPFSDDAAETADLGGDEDSGTADRRPAAKIRVLVNKTAQGFQYHSWREGFV